MEIKLSKNESLVNLGNSLLSFYGIPTFNATYKKLDSLLETQKNKKVCLVLLDGFGKAIIEQYKEYCPFIYSHSFSSFYSIYPPTTVAATNALLLGRYPCETGFVGWSQYFKKHQTIIDVFLGVDSITRERINPHVCDDVLKYENLITLINKTGKYNAQQLMGFDFQDENHESNLNLLFEEADKTIDNYNFTYLYSTEPDHTMHNFGVIHDNVKNKIIELNSLLEKLVNNHKDTLFLVIADHGMVTTTPDFFKDVPELKDCITNEIPVFEPRFAGFFVKNKEKFEEIYNKYYKDKYVLFTKQEILDNHIFGYGPNSEIFLESMTDYYLLSNSKYCFAKFEDFLVGNHAGVTSDEVNLNLSVFNSNYEK